MTGTSTKIVLRIAYNGVVKVLDNVEPHASVESILQQALKLFNVTDRPHAQGLFREDGSEVLTSQSVEAAGLVNDALLFLQPRTQQGGV